MFSWSVLNQLTKKDLVEKYSAWKARPPLIFTKDHDEGDNEDGELGINEGAEDYGVAPENDVIEAMLTLGTSQVQF